MCGARLDMTINSDLASNRPKGRKPGTRNRRTENQVRMAELSGQMPLEYMLYVMRDESNPTDLRLDAAHKAAPYVHQKLAQKIEIDKSVRISSMSEAELIEELSTLLGGAVIDLDAIPGSEILGLEARDRAGEEAEAAKVV